MRKKQPSDEGKRRVGNQGIPRKGERQYGPDRDCGNPVEDAAGERQRREGCKSDPARREDRTIPTLDRSGQNLR
jgi:hypothetical protein